MLEDSTTMSSENNGPGDEVGTGKVADASTATTTSEVTDGKSRDVEKQEDETDSKEADRPKTCKERVIPVLKALKANWIKYHLLWLLVLAIIIGVSWPLPGKTLGAARFGSGICLVTYNATTNDRVCVWTGISALCVTIMFLISGMQLKLSKMRAAFTKWRAILVGYLLVFFITTSFGFAMAAGPKLNPPEFSFGLSLFMIMPTTLSACVVIVGYAKGDTALALLLTVTTNLLGVVILPFTVTWMVSVFHGSSSAQIGTAKVDIVDMCLNLVFTVLIPLLLGAGIRNSSDKIAKKLDAHAFSLKLISACCLATVPWMRISQSSNSFGLVSAGSYVVLIIVATVMHAWFLVLSSAVAFLTMNRKDIESIKCLVIVGAQKTLPVGLSVLELLPDAAIGGNTGLVALAMIIQHLIQTLSDSWFALKWASYSERKAVSAENS